MYRYGYVVTESFSTYGFAQLNCFSSLKHSQIVLVKHYKKIAREDMTVMQLEKTTSMINLQKGI